MKKKVSNNFVGELKHGGKYFNIAECIETNGQVSKSVWRICYERSKFTNIFFFFEKWKIVVELAVSSSSCEIAFLLGINQ